MKCASLFRPILRFCSDVLKVQALLVVASKCVRSQSLAFNWAPRENWPCFCLILNFWPQCNITFRYNMQSRQHDLRKPQTPVSFVLWLVFAMSQLCWLFTCSHICASGWSADDQQIILLLISRWSADQPLVDQNLGHLSELGQPLLVLVEPARGHLLVALLLQQVPAKCPSV